MIVLRVILWLIVFGVGMVLGGAALLLLAVLAA